MTAELPRHDHVWILNKSGPVIGRFGPVAKYETWICEPCGYVEMRKFTNAGRQLTQAEWKALVPVSEMVSGPSWMREPEPRRRGRTRGVDRVRDALIAEYERQHEGNKITAQARDYNPYDGVDMQKMAAAAMDALRAR